VTKEDIYLSFNQEKTNRVVPKKELCVIAIELKISTNHGMICPQIPIGS